VFSEIPFIPYGQLMIWTVLGDVLIQYSFNLTRAQQKPKLFMFLQIGKFMLSTILIIYFVSFRHFGARGQLLGLLIGSICTAAISSALLLKEYFSPRINWSFIQKSLVYGLPLIPHLIAQWVKTSFDRIILENYLNLEAVGIYSFGYNLGLIMNVLVTSINMAYTPYFFEMMKNNHNPKERIKKFLALYVTILGSICLFGILFSNEVIQLIIPATFHSSIPIVPLILFGYLITGYYYLAVNPLFFFMKTKWLPWLTGISASISIGLNFIIIPKWGVFGAALNFVISSFISFIFVFIASRKIWKVDLNYKGFLLLNLIIASAAASMASLGEMELNIGLIIIKLFFIIIFIYLAYILLLRRYKNSFIN
jgi:O-antigen/teichoic acid export membrane protein